MILTSLDRLEIRVMGSLKKMAIIAVAVAVIAALVQQVVLLVGVVGE